MTSLDVRQPAEGSARYPRPHTGLILPNLLARRAAESGTDVFVTEVDGDSLTYAEVHDRALRLATGLRDLGMAPGDRIATLLPNSIDSVLVLCAAGLAGAIHVPLNNAYIGAVLQHAIDVSGPTVLVVDPAYRDRVTEGLSLPASCRIVWREMPANADRSSVSMSRLMSGPRSAARDPVARDWTDISTLLFTSGTTGGSKAVTIPWLQLYLSAVRIWQAQELDSSLVFYSPWPVNHISGTGGIYMTMIVGGRLVLREKWSTSNFVDDVLRHECTSTTLMGEAVGYVQRMTGLEHSRLSHLFISPVTESMQKFLGRLGIRYVTNFNSTEMSSPIGSDGYGEIPAMSCGTVRQGVQVQLVDEDGQVVPDGEPGELLVRTDDPAAMNQGYWGMPEASEKAWARGWFHTGDLVRRRPDGNYVFFGRMKDRLRSRGENVSADELEDIVLRHPGVAQCAAVGRPNDVGEDDIILFVVADGDLTIGQVEEHCEAELPKFMRPAEIRFVTDLPETPTGKVRRAELRETLIREQDSKGDQK